MPCWLARGRGWSPGGEHSGLVQHGRNSWQPWACSSHACTCRAASDVLPRATPARTGGRARQTACKPTSVQPRSVAVSLATSRPVPEPIAGTCGWVMAVGPSRALDVTAAFSAAAALCLDVTHLPAREHPSFWSRGASSPQFIQQKFYPRNTVRLCCGRNSGKPLPCAGSWLVRGAAHGRASAATPAPPPGGPNRESPENRTTSPPDMHSKHSTKAAWRACSATVGTAGQSLWPPMRGPDCPSCCHRQPAQGNWPRACTMLAASSSHAMP